MSRLSALKLWILAGNQGRISSKELKAAVALSIERNAEGAREWLKGFEWSVGRRHGIPASAAVDAVMSAINNLAPQVQVIHRQRLYEWFRKAGMRFSSKATYGRAQIMRVVTVALRGVGRGRRRGGGHFF
jgi:membrane-bound lytic murein transglycosylase B